MADNDDVNSITGSQQQARDQCGEEQLANGDLRIGAHCDQHDGGWNQDAQRTACTHHTCRQTVVIAAFKQDGHRQHTHGYNGSAYDAGGSRKDGRHHNNCQTQATFQGAQQVANGKEQTVCHLGMCQEVCHQDEHGNCHHGIALHLVIYLCGGNIQPGSAPGDNADDDAGAAQHEGQLLTGNKADDHDDK